MSIARRCRCTAAVDAAGEYALRQSACCCCGSLDAPTSPKQGSCIDIVIVHSITAAVVMLHYLQHVVLSVAVDTAGEYVLGQSACCRC
jgi:hypothetical protein